MFVDQTKVDVQAGKDDGDTVAFRHEKHVPLDDPADGDGGRGGSIILVVDSGLRTLMNFHSRRKSKANNGENGRVKSQYGHGAEDVHLRVPMGASICDFNTGELLDDLVKDGRELVVARGGKGGIGSVHFVTPTRAAPETTENGEPEEFRTLRLELKVLADVGLVGFPSVGRSTLLFVVTKTRPKIAAYEFATLTPNLGMVVLPDDRGFSMVGLPGLIKGASKGVGFGIQFLRHVEHTRVVLHLVSMDPNNGRDTYEDYETIRKELAGYTEDLASKKELIVTTQMDIPGSGEKLAEFKRKLGDETVYPISSITRQNVNELMSKTADLVEEVTKEEAGKPTEIKVAEKEYVYKRPEDDGFKVERTDEHSFVVTGNKLEYLVQRMNLDHANGIMLLAHKLKRMGVDDALRKKGAVNGDDVSIANFAFELVN